MRFLAAISCYGGLFLLEVAILPRLTGSAAPTLTLAGLVVGLALLDFRSGFWFAGLTGLLHDTVLAGSTSYTIFALTLLFAMRGFRALTQWDVPLADIAAMAFGLLMTPLAWVGASIAAGIFFAVPERVIAVGDLAHRTVVKEILFSFLWFPALSWLLIRRSRWQRAREVLRLSGM